MELQYRRGDINDLPGIKVLALKAWRKFEQELTIEHWNTLHAGLTNNDTFTDLLNNSTCVLCITGNDEIIGMSFLVPQGNPTEIYEAGWCYIRFVSVDPGYSGQGIGRQLTEQSIQIAKDNGAHAIALHTSEMMENARRLYENLGFTILREIDQRLGKRYWLYTLDV